MKLMTIHFLLIIALFSMSNCKKEDDDNNNNTTTSCSDGIKNQNETDVDCGGVCSACAVQTITFDANGNVTVPNDANGACYASKGKFYLNNTGTSNDDLQFTFAWFGSSNAFKNAGTVKVNTQENSIANINLYSYLAMDDSYLPSNSVNWDVSGNTSNGVPGFNFTDTQNFPSNGGDFVLPTSININNTLNVNFTPITNVYVVAYTLEGNKGRKNKFVEGGASSVTFTAAELNEVAFENDFIGLTISALVYQPQTLSGKKIYFVKQFQHYRETTTL